MLRLMLDIDAGTLNVAVNNKSSHVAFSCMRLCDGI
jgi:hypothetical protein